MPWHGSAQPVDKGGQEIDGLDKIVRDGPARGIGLGVRVNDDQRNARRLPVKQLFVAKPMVAQIVAMVAGEHDHRGVQRAPLIQEGHQASDLVVDLPHHAHIDRDDGRPHLVPAERLAFLATVIGGVDRMRVFQFAPITHGGQHIACRVHIVVGRRRHVGPVRLDVA